MPSTHPSGSAVIGQSGGPTVVINQSLVGVVETLRGNPGVTKILGCLHGVSGIVKDQYLDLTNIPQPKLDAVAQTPSSALGSSRDKPDAEYCKKILDSFTRQNVRYFFYIGGNDSSDTCRIVSEMAEKSAYPLRAFHVPKTIDNDLMHNDHCPGYGSAAQFVACAMIGDNLDNLSLPGVKIDVIMGRHAGFLTAASVMARRRDTDGPHLIYVPESAFDIDKFLADVDAVYKKHNRCLIAVSEGIHDAAKTPIAQKLAEQSGLPVERDSHGNVQLAGSGILGDFLADLVKKKLNIKRVRADTLGYLQRSFLGCTSPSDATEARASAREAAKLALSPQSPGTTVPGNGSISIQRTSDSPYTIAYKRINFSDVAAKTRTLDPKFIQGTNNISDSFKSYLSPLIGSLPTVETLR